MANAQHQSSSLQLPAQKRIRRAGRPPSQDQDKHTERVVIRYTPGDFQLLKSKIPVNSTRARYIRDCSLHRPIDPPLPQINIDLYRQIVGISNNLNQLTRSVNSGHCFADDNLLKQARDAVLRAVDALTARSAES
jgi:hypothetical protein